MPEHACDTRAVRCDLDKVHRGWKDIAKRMGVTLSTVCHRAYLPDPLPLRQDHRGIYLRERDLIRWLARHRPGPVQPTELVHGWRAIVAYLGVTWDQYKARRRQWEASLPHMLDPQGNPVAHAAALDDWASRQDLPHQAAMRLRQSSNPRHRTKKPRHVGPRLRAPRAA